ncbi:MAG: ribonuclease H-like domain-containing protein [Candidatus Acidiferrales bacterium]
MSTTGNLFGAQEIYFDIETLRLADEVPGGWKNIRAFGLAVAVTWDSAGGFRNWFEPDALALISELGRFERFISFNGNRFDFEVLRAYAPVDTAAARSFDIHEDLYRRLGHRVKLEQLARETLGSAKGGDGLDAVRWWREGNRQRVVEYCQQDVALLRDIVAHGRQNGCVIVASRKVPVEWR